MRFFLKGVEYDVTWRYDNVQSKDCATSVVKTTCTISRVDNDKIGKDRFVAITSAYCVQDPRDNFEKSKGRRFSLAKASAKFSNDRTIRKIIWANYFRIMDLYLISDEAFIYEFKEVLD